MGFPRVFDGVCELPAIVLAYRSRPFRDLLPQWLNGLFCFFLLGSFPLKKTKTKKFELFLLGKLTK